MLALYRQKRAFQVINPVLPVPFGVFRIVQYQPKTAKPADFISIFGVERKV
jgi:hypothetical protein